MLSDSATLPALLLLCYSPFSLCLPHSLSAFLACADFQLCSSRCSLTLAEAGDTAADTPAFGIGPAIGLLLVPPALPALFGNEGVVGREIVDVREATDRANRDEEEALLRRAGADEGGLAEEDWRGEPSERLELGSAACGVAS